MLCDLQVVGLHVGGKGLGDRLTDWLWKVESLELMMDLEDDEHEDDSGGDG